MNNNSSDDFFELFSNPENTWNEKEWSDYIQKAKLEVDKFAEFYKKNRPSGHTLDHIANEAGWSIECELVDDEAEFSSQPWTLLNHPLYIVTKGLLKCFNEYFEEIVKDTSPNLVWELSKEASKLENAIFLAISSIDEGESILAKCNYKNAISATNDIFASINKLPESNTKNELFKVVFDLRQLCIDLAKLFSNKPEDL